MASHPSKNDFQSFNTDMLLTDIAWVIREYRKGHRSWQLNNFTTTSCGVCRHNHIASFLAKLIIHCNICYLSELLSCLWKLGILSNGVVFLYAIGIFCASLLGVLCFHHHFNVAYTTGMGVRTALTTAIYRKVERWLLVAAGIINRAHVHTWEEKP